MRYKRYCPITPFHSLSLLFTPLLLLLFFNSLHAQTALSAAQQGDLAYSQKDYKAAISHYKDALASGQCSPELLYNMGGAYYRLDSLSQAILCYERVLRLDPSFDDARDNLELANSHTVDRITPLPAFFLADWIHSLSTNISVGAWRMITLLFLLLLGAAVAVFLLFHDPLRRKLSFTAIILFGILTTLSFLLLLSAVSHFNDDSQAIVTQESVTVKNEPGEYSTDKLILHEGTKVTVTLSQAGHHKITLPDGTTGWVDTNAVERIKN